MIFFIMWLAGAIGGAGIGYYFGAQYGRRAIMDTVDKALDRWRKDEGIRPHTYIGIENDYPHTSGVRLPYNYRPHS